MSEPSSEAACYDEAAMLLPWYVIGQLSPEESAAVEAHLQTCSICRQDAAHERELRKLVCAEQIVEFAPQPGLQRLSMRIQSEEEAITGRPSGRRSENVDLKADLQAATKQPSRGKPQVGKAMLYWLSAAVVVQTLGLGFLASLLWQGRMADRGAPSYVTLSSPRSSLGAAGQIRAVFAPSTRLIELQSICKAAGVTVVAGPSAAGVYTLAVAEDAPGEHSIDLSLASLRADAHVVFAEPVEH